jgi:hypothetical protein
MFNRNKKFNKRVVKKIVHGIINTVKTIFRSNIIMEPKKLFLFIVDTTENQFANIGRGILNTQIIYAKDKIEAKELFIKIYRPNILQQIQYCTYIYDLNEVETTLKNLDPSKFTPLFSHLPLQGGRPPKPEPLIVDKNIEQIGQLDQPVTQPVRLNPQIPTRSVQQPRHGDLTPEQMNLIKAVGAIPTPQGENAGFNPRVNASVGVHGHIPQNMVQSQSESQMLNQTQLDMLRGAGVNLADLHMNIEMEQSEVAPLLAQQQAELASISEKPLSDEEIAALQSQI